MTSEFTPEELRRAAKARIARLFNTEIDAISLEFEFGEHLNVSFRSDFRANEHDQIYYDIRDAADRDTLKQIESGALVVRTVGDYCEHMVHCFETNRSEVLRILSLK